MTESPNKHWTADADLLERFVLHRLDEMECRRLETHLVTCEECLQAVKNEQMIVLGLKRAGRDELKARLKDRLVAGMPSPVPMRVPWTHLASAAAVVVTVVGIGIYNGWFVKGTWSTSGQSTTIRERIEQPRVEGQVAEPHQGARRNESVSPIARPDQPPRETPKTMARREGAELQREATESMKLQAPASSLAGVQKNDAVLDEEAVRAERNRSFVSPSLWAEGILIAGPADGNRLLKETGKTDLRQKSVQPSGPIQQRTGSEQGTAVAVIQKSITDLPPAQRMRQQQVQRDVVPTNIQQVGERFQFVLYRDGHLFPGDQPAILNQIGSDSLILSIGETTICYKIEGGVEALRAQKK